MKVHHAATRFLGIAMALALGSTPSFARADAVQWEIIPGGATLQSGDPICLYNTVASKYVAYGRRTFGINLVWCTPRPTSNFALARESGGTGPLVHGERVALHEHRGGYIRYGERRWGINLVWSSSPVYEWEVRGGGNGSAIGGSKADRTLVSLYNRRTGEYLVYKSRRWGINLGWAR